MDHRPKFKSLTTKFVENFGINLCDLGLSNGFLGMTAKQEETWGKKNGLPQNWTFVFQRTLSRKWRHNLQNGRKSLFHSDYL